MMECADYYDAKDYNEKMEAGYNDFILSLNEAQMAEFSRGGEIFYVLHANELDKGASPEQACDTIAKEYIPTQSFKITKR